MCFHVQNSLYFRKYGKAANQIIWLYGWPTKSVFIWLKKKKHFLSYIVWQCNISSLPNVLLNISDTENSSDLENVHCNK